MAINRIQFSDQTDWRPILLVTYHFAVSVFFYFFLFLFLYQRNYIPCQFKSLIWMKNTYYYFLPSSKFGGIFGTNLQNLKDKNENFRTKIMPRSISFLCFHIPPHKNCEYSLRRYHLLNSLDWFDLATDWLSVLHIRKTVTDRQQPKIDWPSSIHSSWFSISFLSTPACMH